MLSFLQTLQKHPDARKIFGKRELKIIEKQMLGIKLTQSEKNRLSRDIRKKLIFIQEISKYSKEFDLKYGQNIKEIIQDAVEVILEHPWHNKIKKIILFGSTAEHQRTFRSDIDIAIEFFTINLKEATEFRIETLGRVSEQVDLQVYNVLPEKIKKEIDSQGKILYEKSKRKN